MAMWSAELLASAKMRFVALGTDLAQAPQRPSARSTPCTVR
jgi:hypothetical protein